MTELELYKFIEDSESMTSFDGECAIIWIYHFNIDAFCDLIGKYYLEDGGIEARLEKDFIAVDMTEICEDNNIDMLAVFGK